MAHILQLRVVDSQLNASLLIVSDVSDYDPLIPVKSNTLFIQVPGFTDPIEVLFPVGLTTAYSSRNLGLSSNKIQYDIPDGLYTITYSIAPNDTVNTVYYHFRTARLEKQLYGAIANLRIRQDAHVIDDGGNVIITKLEQVYLKCLLYLEALKGSIRNNTDLAAANQQYQDVVTMLNDSKAMCDVWRL